jgi:hypothetical protein
LLLARFICHHALPIVFYIFHADPWALPFAVYYTGQKQYLPENLAYAGYMRIENAP